jgi:hypothetical protein
MHKLSHCTLRTSISSLKLSAIYQHPRLRSLHDDLVVDDKRNKRDLQDSTRFPSQLQLATANWHKQILICHRPPPADPETVQFLQNTWESFSLTEDGEPDPEAICYRPRMQSSSTESASESTSSVSTARVAL